MSVNSSPRTWVSGETVTAAEMNAEIRDFAIGVQAAGVAYSPSTTGITLGNGTINARWTRVGQWVDFTVDFTFGSTSNITSSPTFTLPVAALSANHIFIGSAFDTSAGNTWPAAGVATSTTAIVTRQAPVVAGSSYAAISSTSPFTWATGDVLHISGRYEAA